MERLLATAVAAPTRHLFDVEDQVSLAPGDMPARITQWYDDAGAPPAVVATAVVPSDTE